MPVPVRLQLTESAGNGTTRVILVDDICRIGRTLRATATTSPRTSRRARSRAVRLAGGGAAPGTASPFVVGCALVAAVGVVHGEGMGVVLPIAVAASESLAEHEDLVWAAFCEASMQLRATLWEPPPYRFVVGPYTSTDRWLAVELVAAGRHVEAVPGRALPPPGRPLAAVGDVVAMQEQAAWLARLDEHARLGWAGAIVLADGDGYDAAAGLAAAADRHHRSRVQTRTLAPHAAERVVDGLPARAGQPPGRPTS